jgi:hypothetical protein
MRQRRPRLNVAGSHGVAGGTEIATPPCEARSSRWPCACRSRESARSSRTLNGSRSRKPFDHLARTIDVTGRSRAPGIAGPRIRVGRQVQGMPLPVPEHSQELQRAPVQGRSGGLIAAPRDTARAATHAGGSGSPAVNAVDGETTPGGTTTCGRHCATHTGNSQRVRRRHRRLCRERTRAEVATLRIARDWIAARGAGNPAGRVWSFQAACPWSVRYRPCKYLKLQGTGGRAERESSPDGQRSASCGSGSR